MMPDQDRMDFEKQLHAKNLYRQRMLDSSLGNLLATKNVRLRHLGTSVEDEGHPERRVVRLAADALGMEMQDISLPEEIRAGLDSLQLLRRYADKAGLRLRLAALPDNWHREDCGPMIGWYGPEREPVTLLPDPDGGYRAYSLSHPDGIRIDNSTADAVGRDAFVCYPGLPARPLGIKEFFSIILSTVAERDKRTILFTSLLASLLPLMTPLITENIFSHIIPIKDRQALGTVTQVMLVTGFTMVTLSFVRSIACLRIKNKTVYTIEAMLWSRLISLPAKFFRTYQVGDLVSRMQAANSMASVFDSGFISTVFNIVSSVWTLLLMLYYNSYMTLYALLVCLASLILSAFIYRNIVPLSRESLLCANRLNARVLQLINGLPVFHLAGAEERAFFLWSRVFGAGIKCNLDLRRQSNRITILNSTQPLVLSLIMYWIAKHVFFDSSYLGSPLSFTEFIAFMGLYAGFNTSVMQTIPLLSSLWALQAQADNIQPVLDAAPEVMPDLRDAGPLSGRIETRNLSFSYTPGGKKVLHDVNICVEPGQTVAFVGASGGGKSTLVRLLLGFEQPLSGGVYYDGHDLRSFNPSSVRRQTGVVMQNTQIMAGDIFTNIVGTLPLSRADAMEAARKVGLADDIESMPLGLDTLVSEGGGNISGGQRQRILLARSIVSNPKILILDEATSALDNITQKIVTDSLKAMACTRIVVAHRLSTIRDADKIYVINDGTVVEEGNFDELMRRNGWFARLAGRQLM